MLNVHSCITLLQVIKMSFHVNRKRKKWKTSNNTKTKTLSIEFLSLCLVELEWCRPLPESGIWKDYHCRRFYLIGWTKHCVKNANWKCVFIHRDNARARPKKQASKNKILHRQIFMCFDHLETKKLEISFNPFGGGGPKCVFSLNCIRWKLAFRLEMMATPYLNA